MKENLLFDRFRKNKVERVQNTSHNPPRVDTITLDELTEGLERLYPSPKFKVVSVECFELSYRAKSFLIYNNEVGRLCKIILPVLKDSIHTIFSLGDVKNELSRINEFKEFKRGLNEGIEQRIYRIER